MSRSLQSGALVQPNWQVQTPQWQVPCAEQVSLPGQAVPKVAHENAGAQEGCDVRRATGLGHENVSIRELIAPPTDAIMV